MISDHDQLTLTVSVDDSVTRADDSVSLGLIVTELVQDGLVRDVGPRPVATPCPGCRVGVLRPRSGRTGHFWGCSTFPACTYTCNTLPVPGALPSVTMSTTRRPPF